MPLAGTESGEAREVDHEGSDIRGRFGWSANDTAVIERDVEHVDLVFGEHVECRHVWRVAGTSFQVHDTPCGHGIECEALAQIVGVIESSILDPGADLEDPEVFLDGSACFVPCDDAPGIVDFGLALGGEEHSVERHLAFRRFGFEDRDGKHGERCVIAGPVGRRHEVDHRGTEFKPGLAFVALAGTTTGADGDGLCAQNRLRILEVPQLSGAAVDGDPALAAAVGTHHEPVASLSCRSQQVPYVSFAITDRNHAAVGDLPGALKAVQPAHAFRHVVRRFGDQRAVALCRVEFEHSERASGFRDRKPDMGEQAPGSRSAADQD